jgi:hypothetical protein
MTMTMALKRRENRIRRQASRRGLRVVKTPGDLSWGDMGAYVVMEGEKVIHVIHPVVFQYDRDRSSGVFRVLSQRTRNCPR